MTSRFTFIETKLAGLYIAQRKPIEDTRGFFARFFCSEEFCELGLLKPIAQINHSLTHQKGAVRGMHFQYPPHVETKIVNCLKGKIFDVAIDIRHGSPTFLQFYGAELSANNFKSLVIPEGFAHGFQTLTDDCELLYLHTAPHAAEAQGALHVNDPLVNIKWPLAITEVSERDSGHSFIGEDFDGVQI
jgi:dTDP-4-dehydrorhamnose 3,5-epimerase